MTRRIIGFVLLTLSTQGWCQLVEVDWVSQIGGVNDENGLQIDTDSDGNIYSVGSFQGTLDFDPSAATENLTAVSGTDIFIQKLDAERNLIWIKQLECTENVGLPTIVIDPSNNIVIAGSFDGTIDVDPSADVYSLTATSAFSNDCFVMKLNADGEFIWAKQQFAAEDFVEESFGFSVYVSAIDSENNIYLTANFYVDINVGSIVDPYALEHMGTLYEEDLAFFKFDPAGNLAWCNYFVANAIYGSVYLDQNDDVYFTGYFGGTVDFDLSPASFELTALSGDLAAVDAVIAKYNSDGDFIWAKSFGGLNAEIVFNTAISLANEIYIVGMYADVVDFDPGAGVSEITAEGDFDLFITKFDVEGNFMWAKSIGGEFYDSYPNVEVDGNGDLYLTGIYTNSIDVDPDESIVLLESDAYSNCFFIKLNRNGNLLWAGEFASSEYAPFLSVHVVSPSEVYCYGGFSVTLDCAPDTDEINITSNGNNDFVVIKLSSENAVGIGKEDEIPAVSLYPNPTKDRVMIDFGSSILDDRTVIVYDLLGQTVYSNSAVKGTSISLDCSLYPKGVYLVSIFNNNELSSSTTLKLIVE